MTSVHGFVDESIRSGVYRLTVVRVVTRDLALVTRNVREAIPPGRVRIHLSSERPSTRREILRACGRLEVAATVLETPHRRGDDQPARDRCLRALVGAIESDPITVLILDTRGPDRDKLDRSALALALGERHLHYANRGSRDEPLLALPDAIGWAIGAGQPFAALVSGISRTHRC